MTLHYIQSLYAARGAVMPGVAAEQQANGIVPRLVNWQDLDGSLRTLGANLVYPCRLASRLRLDGVPLQRQMSFEETMLVNCCAAAKWHREELNAISQASTLLPISASFAQWPNLSHAPR